MGRRTGPNTKGRTLSSSTEPIGVANTIANIVAKALTSREAEPARSPFGCTLIVCQAAGSSTATKCQGCILAPLGALFAVAMA